MLEFCAVCVNYGPVRAVDHFTLNVRDRELMTLLGPSGCGKSTLLRIAGGFLTPVSGKVLLDGRDVTCVPPEYRATATVFQSHALFPHMNAGDNVAYGLRVQGMGKDESARIAASMLEKVGLGGAGKRPVQDLSGGQQQRVALARALVVNPRVLLLDEPLSSLDANLRVKLRAEIRRLQKELGMTALYVTHDREEALSISDHVAVMRAGHLVQVGTPEEVFAQPSDEFVASFVGDANVLRDQVGKLLFVRPGEIGLDAAASARGRIIERQFKGGIATYRIKMDSNAPDIPLPDLSGGETRFTRVADQEIMVDVPAPEERPLHAGDITGIKMAVRHE